MRHFGRNRVFHPHGIGSTAKQPRGSGVDERIGDAFVVAQAPQWCAVRRVRGFAAASGSALARPAGPAPSARPTAWSMTPCAPPLRPDRPRPEHRGARLAGLRHVAVQREAQAPASVRRCSASGMSIPTSEITRVGVQPVGAGHVSSGAPSCSDVRRLAAAQVQHHLRRQIKAGQGERRIDARAQTDSARRN